MAKKDDVKTPAAKAPDADDSNETERDEDEDGEEETDEEGAGSDEEDEDAEDEDADDEDEDEDDDYEDEDEDEEVDAANAASMRGVVAPAQLRGGPIPEPEDPTWWLPHAVLGAIVLIGVLGFFGVFTSILGPPLQKLGIISSASPAESAKPATSAPAKPLAPQTQPTGAQTAKPAEETYGAKHIIVMYKGSMRAPATVTRTKDEAKARAEEVLKKLKGGAKFDDLVGDYSDEPNAGARKGDLGRFHPNAMHPLFTEAVKKLKVGETSDIVETPFGFHVIVRTF